MSRDTDIMTSLREVGYRLTPQRMMILSIINESKGHVTAEAIHERVCKEYPFVDISTVYRTLQLLKKLRLVTETDLGSGVVQYELSDRGRHHHLVCRSCGQTTPLDGSFLEPLAQNIEKTYRFRADVEHFAIFGLCAACQDGSTPHPRGRRRSRARRGVAPHGS